MISASFLSFTPSMGHLFFVCVFITGTQGRSYTAPHGYSEVGASYRQGGFPKFPPIDDLISKPHCRRSRSPKVVGGSTATYGDHPWQVELEVYKGREGFMHHCGGAVITPFHFLTAAHCLHDLNKSDFRIKVGDHNLDQKDEDEQMFGVESWRVHPNFRKGGTYTNDMAVVKISAQQGQGIRMSSLVSPVCLPLASTPYTAGANCKVTGWGLTDPSNDYSHSTVLQNAEVPLMSNQLCKELHGQDFGPGMVCAGYLTGKIDSCNGDSGGPLVCKVNGVDTLLGVVSWGIDCAEPKFPGVYSSTQYYLDWIKKAVEEL